jgi:hypothetical protein
VLDNLNATADGRLRTMRPPRRTREAAKLGDAKKRFNTVDADGSAFLMTIEQTMHWRKMTGEIAWLAAGLIAGGILTGILAGLFGVGGGSVIVPTLYEVFGAVGVSDTVRMQLCIGTSLAIITPTTLHSYHVHKMQGLVLPRCLATLSVVVDAGRRRRLSSRGGHATDIFKAAFVIMACVIAVSFCLEANAGPLSPNCSVRQR